MQQVFTALDAATAAGVGPVLLLDSPQNLLFRMQIIVTGSPSQISFVLEASLDGVNFADFGNDFVGTPAAELLTGPSNSGPILAFRFNLRSITGGSSPTVTALLGVVPA